MRAIRSRDSRQRTRLTCAPATGSNAVLLGAIVVRFCQHCRKNVYNLSGMSRWDAADFVREAEGRLCVRFYRRRDGTLLTEDCPVGWRAARRRLLRWVGSSLAVAFGLFGVKPPAIEQYSETMGLVGEPRPITQEYASPPQLGLSVAVIVGAILAIIRGGRADRQATSPTGREVSTRSRTEL